MIYLITPKLCTYLSSLSVRLCAQFCILISQLVRHDNIISINSISEIIPLLLHYSDYLYVDTDLFQPAHPSLD